MAELLIRAGHNDHTAIGDLLAPGGAVALRQPIGRLVADAQTAVQRPSLARDANLAGVPYLIDPVTPLLQGPTAGDDSWVKRLPYGRADEIEPERFSGFEIHQLASQVVDFQMAAGATAIIPPYLYATVPHDPAFDLSLRLLVATARYMRREHVNLPLFPIFCGSHRGFTPEPSWGSGIDRFLANALDVGPQAIGVCFTPVGDPSDSYSKVLRLFLAAEHFARAGVSTIAWRQGTFGPGLVAAGLHGYETGVGVREKANIRDLITSKKPKIGGRGGATPQMVFLEGLGRSVKSEVAANLLGDPQMRARLICDDERCCPNGAASMLEDRARHTICARARRLDDLRSMPKADWRLHQVAKDAKQAASTTRRANLVLGALGHESKLPDKHQMALGRVAEFLRQRNQSSLSA